MRLPLNLYGDGNPFLSGRQAFRTVPFSCVHHQLYSAKSGLLFEAIGDAGRREGLEYSCILILLAVAGGPPELRMFQCKSERAAARWGLLIY